MTVDQVEEALIVEDLEPPDGAFLIEVVSPSDIAKQLQTVYVKDISGITTFINQISGETTNLIQTSAMHPYRIICPLKTLYAKIKEAEKTLK